MLPSDENGKTKMKHEKAKKIINRLYHTALGAILLAPAFMIYALNILPVKFLPGADA